MNRQAKYQKLIDKSPEKFKDIIKWSDYIPHKPTSKQIAFLLLDSYREAFYGGAAGGGKSDALLMAALQYVDNQFYNAIIFRKTFTDLKLPSALISRSFEWLDQTDAKWNGSDHKWSFPSGATLCFGYLESELHKYRYQSAEFQFIAFDELSQQYEDDYLYMFSRLRRGSCSIHQIDNDGKPIYIDGCAECHLRRSIPLRVRAASNPGGVGHIWVKNRFLIGQRGGTYLGNHPQRPYVPAFISDNPYLDQFEYKKSLGELDPVTREQLLKGDWGISSDGRIKKSWMKYFSWRGDHIVLGKDGRGPIINKDGCYIFQTVDPAASVRAGPGDTHIWRKMPSYTVIGTWLLSNPEGYMFLIDMKRFRKEIPEILLELKEGFKEFMEKGLQPSFIAIEADGLGIGVYQMMKRTGLPIKDIRSRSKDKLVRATDFINRVEQGKVFLPQVATWLEDAETELFTWTGHPHETDDIVDMCAHAAQLASQLISGGMGEFGGMRDLPTAY